MNLLDSWYSLRLLAESCKFGQSHIYAELPVQSYKVFYFSLKLSGRLYLNCDHDMKYWGGWWCKPCKSRDGRSEPWAQFKYKANQIDPKRGILWRTHKNAKGFHKSSPDPSSKTLPSFLNFHVSQTPRVVLPFKHRKGPCRPAGNKFGGPKS